MADNRENDGRGPNESWVKRLTPENGEVPEGVKIYVGLLRESPSDADLYLVYLGLDMRSCLHVEKKDVLHWEDLPQDKSPFGTLGGTRIYVRRGAKIKVVTTSTMTLEAGTDDEFDLDIRLGARRSFAASAAGDLTIPDTGCGAVCDALPPFTGELILESAFPCVATQGLCGVTQVTCGGCPPPTQGGKTCGVNCHITQSLTCITRCGACQTGGTCATCQTGRTNCVAVNTYNAQCGQVAFGPWWNTRPFTACNHNTCIC